MKHDQLLEKEKSLRRQYFLTQRKTEMLKQMTTLPFTQTKQAHGLQKRLDKIMALAKSHLGEVCDESQRHEPCEAHDFNIDHWVLNAKIKLAMQKNIYTKQFWSYYAAQGDPMLDLEDASYYYVDTLEKLKKAFLNYNAYRQVFIYKDLVFVNQDPSGGWEALTLKVFKGELVQFESISMVHIIEAGKTHDGKTFEQEINFYLSRTREQVDKFKQTWSWN